MTPLQFRNGASLEAGRVEPTEINPAPDLEPLRILAELRERSVKLLTGITGQDDGLFQAHFIHGADPAIDVRLGTRIVVRMDIDDRIARLFDPMSWDLEDRVVFVVLEQHLVWRRLGKGGRAQAAEQRQA